MDAMGSMDFHVLHDGKKGVKNTVKSENGRIITNDEAEKKAEEIAFLEELESRLDWSQPLLSQFHKVAPHYEAWVYRPVYRKCKIFSSPLLECTTFTPWYIVPIVWVPVMLYIGWTQYLEHVDCGESCREGSLSTLLFVYHTMLGVLIWTSLEYFIHRWVFHLDPGSSITMKKIHFLLHGIHHKTPFDAPRQYLSPIITLIGSLVIFFPVHFVVTYWRIKYFGTIIGYLIYEMLHYYVHHGSPKDGTYLYYLKRLHSNHHFINRDRAFGIMWPLWDFVFNSFVHVRK